MECTSHAYIQPLGPAPAGRTGLNRQASSTVTRKYDYQEVPRPRGILGEGSGDKDGRRPGVDVCVWAHSFILWAGITARNHDRQFAGPPEPHGRKK